jgi:hypothetical protein
MVPLPPPVSLRVFHRHRNSWTWEAEAIPEDQAVERDDAPLVHLPYEGRALPAFFANQIIVARGSPRLS